MKMLQFVLGCLVCLSVLFFECNATVNAGTKINKITLKEALEKGKGTLGNEWRIAFISNTGVTQEVTTHQINSPAEGLMDKKGKAGQWVIEYFLDKPTNIEADGRKGKEYPFQLVLVTSGGVSKLPASTLAVPNQIAQIKDEYIKAFEAARNRAIAKINNKFDLMSAASDVRSDGTCFWVFRFYDLKNESIIGTVLISGDGQEIKGSQIK